jgi:ankyrin repeat protein
LKNFAREKSPSKKKTITTLKKMDSPLIDTIKNWQNYDDIFQRIDFLVDEQHIDMELTDKYGQTALDYAFYEVSCIALHLLKKGANAENAFQKAITCRHEHIATWLVQNKLVQLTNYSYWNEDNSCLASAIIWSIHLGWDSTASAIIDDPSFADSIDWHSNCFIGVYSPLLFAIYKGNEFLIDKIMSNDPTLTGYDFHKAIALGCDSKMTRIFLETIDINTIFENEEDDDDEDVPHGNTLLHTAISFGNHEALHVLITNDADDSIKNKGGKTPGECYGSKWSVYKCQILLDSFEQLFIPISTLLEENLVDTNCIESVLQYYCGDC